LTSETGKLKIKFMNIKRADIEKTIQKDPGNRYRSVKELLDDIIYFKKKCLG
jgi:hypothetical protein